MKYVKNVTTKPLRLQGQILTLDGFVPITYRISAGGTYLLDHGVTYSNLDDLINEGKLLPDEMPPVFEPKTDSVPATSEVDLPVDPDITDEDLHDFDQVETKVEDEVLDEEVDIELPDETDPPVEDTHSAEVHPTDPDSPFVCPHCGAEYATERGLTRHISSKHPSV